MDTVIHGLTWYTSVYGLHARCTCQFEIRVELLWVASRTLMILSASVVIVSQEGMWHHSWTLFHGVVTRIYCSCTRLLHDSDNMSLTCLWAYA